MKNGIKKVLIVESLILVSFLACFFILTDLENAHITLWTSFAFGIIAFFVAAGAIFLADKTKGDVTTEINLVSVYCSVVYLIVAEILNIRFMFLDSEKVFFAVLISNLVLIVIFVAVMLGIDSNKKTVLANEQKLSAHMNPISEISMKVAGLLVETDDAKIKSAILKLKETVEYGGNISTGQTYPLEMEFSQMVDEIQEMIQGEVEGSEIEKKIKEALMLWKKRNSIASMK